jgi:hypothetical protein
MKVPNLFPKGVNNLEVARVRLVSAEHSVEAAKFEWKAAKHNRREAKENAFRAKKRFKRAKQELAEARSAFAETERHQEVKSAAATATRKTRTRATKPILAKTRRKNPDPAVLEAPAADEPTGKRTKPRKRRTGWEVATAISGAPAHAEIAPLSDLAISPETAPPAEPETPSAPLT